MTKTVNPLHLLFVLTFMLSPYLSWAQEGTPPASAATAPVATPPPVAATGEAQTLPNLDEKMTQDLAPVEETIKAESTGRVRNYLNLIVGLDEDQKLELPPGEYAIKKGTAGDLVDVKYAKDLNIFRFYPKKEGFGILTIHDKKTGVILSEVRVEVRRTDLEKIVREVKALLNEVDGITVKIVNNRVLIDGQVILPKDLFRISNVVKQFDNVKSIVTLSPISRKKIAEYIQRDINNPEVSVRVVNEAIVLEGLVDPEISARACDIAALYLPERVEPKGDIENLNISKVRASDGPNAASSSCKASIGLIDRMTRKPASAPPPPKMIQVVVHFVELLKNYNNSFNFQFTPAINEESGMQISSGGGSSGASFSAIISNLFPKLNWAKSHGYARLLESTSVLVKDGSEGVVNKTKTIQVANSNALTGANTNPVNATVGLAVTPSIVEGQTGGVLLNNLTLSISDFTGQSTNTTTSAVKTSIIVRDRQSAAIGGLMRNYTATSYNDPQNMPENPIISLRAGKKYLRDQAQFVVFATPIIKASASAGVEQVKKKFRMKE